MGQNATIKISCLMRLTQREWWAIVLRAKGVQGKQAAHLMGISIHTYRTYVRHSLESLRELAPNHSFESVARGLIEELTHAMIEELVRVLMQERESTKKRPKKRRKK